ncbi:hypothetical protein ACFL0B_06800 [Thermodesulfobacteriota bacterium]
MTHGVLFLIGCIIIILTRRLYYRNFELFLCLLITVNFDFFHLIPRIGSSDLYRESLLVVLLFYLFEEYIARDHIFHKKNIGSLAFPSAGIYRYIVLGYFAIGTMGVWVAFYNGQSLELGVRTFKFYPLVLVYFLIIKRGLNVEKFTCYFLWMATAIAALVFIQFLIYGKMSFFFFYEDSLSHVRGIGTDRGLRLLEGSTIILIGMITAYIKWLKTHRAQFLSMTIFLLTHIFIVMQTRSILVSIILVMFLVTFLIDIHKKGSLIKKLYLVAIGVLLIAFYVIYYQDVISGQGIVTQTINDLQGITFTGQGAGTLQIRLLCYQYYWQELQTFWLTGRGLLSSAWPGNPDAYLSEVYNFYLSDIGVFHVFLNFGLAGAIFLVIMVLATLMRLGCLIDTAPEVACYFLLGIILLPIRDMFFRLDCIFVFAIFAACADLVLNSMTIQNKLSDHLTPQCISTNQYKQVGSRLA